MTPLKAQEQPGRQIVLSVNEQELKTLGEALESLPFKTVAPLLQKLQGQVQQQMRVGAAVNPPNNPATTVTVPPQGPEEKK